jgi:hypothetical protein
MRAAVKRYGADERIYIALIGIAGVIVALLLYDLLFAVFPMKLK